MATQKNHSYHFLLVSVHAQGHINPARRLAHNLVRSTGALATLAVPTSAYRTMFPSAGDETEQSTDGLIFYTQYSNGSEQGLSFTKDLPAIKLHIKDSLSLLAKDLAACGRPVTCIIYALLLSMAADVARELTIPSVLFWIQPAAVFSIYNSYFHGYNEIIHAHDNDPSFTISLPRLPPLQIRDLPSFVTTPISDDNPYIFLYLLLKDVFENLDRESALSRPRVLVNTFQELESDVLSSIEEMELIAVGPLMTTEQTLSKGSEHSQGDLYQEDSSGYMAWLDTKMERSVVYVSFGSISTMSGRQMKEIKKGLEESGRPYLWVVRRDNEERERIEGGEMGMVVEWCSQDKVLSHSSIGCFVTHCGWNSTLESMVGGVPMVMVPQWTDQTTNAWLAEGEWGTGVRASVDGEGVVEGSELQRCLELVMGEEEKGEEIRRRTAMWSEKAVAAMGQSGSSCRNLTAFVRSLETDKFGGFSKSTELSSPDE